MIFATTYFFKTKKTFQAANIKDLINQIGDYSYDFNNMIGEGTFYFKIRGQQIYKDGGYPKTAKIEDALYNFAVRKKGEEAINHLKNCGFTIYEGKEI